MGRKDIERDFNGEFGQIIFMVIKSYYPLEFGNQASLNA